MGQKGRPRKPLALKLLSGDTDPRYINPREPAGVRGIPPKPEGLGWIAEQEWDRLAPVLDRMGVLTESDGPALALLCQWAEITGKYLALEGCGTPRPKGGRRASTDEGDAFGRAERSSKLYLNLLARFGMTPADRSRVSAEGGAPDALGEFLARREKKDA